MCHSHPLFASPRAKQNVETTYMPSLDHLLAFAAATLVFAYIPGPAILYTAAQTLARGRAGGLMAASASMPAAIAMSSPRPSASPPSSAMCRPFISP